VFSIQYSRFQDIAIYLYKTLIFFTARRYA